MNQSKLLEQKSSEEIYASFLKHPSDELATNATGLSSLERRQFEEGKDKIVLAIDFLLKNGLKATDFSKTFKGKNSLDRVQKVFDHLKTLAQTKGVDLESYVNKELNPLSGRNDELTDKNKVL